MITALTVSNHDHAVGLALMVLSVLMLIGGILLTAWVGRNDE